MVLTGFGDELHESPKDPTNTVFTPTFTNLKSKTCYLPAIVMISKDRNRTYVCRFTVRFRSKTEQSPMGLTGISLRKSETEQ